MANKEKVCKNCGCAYEIVHICDYCKKEMMYIAVEVDFGYGSYCDGDRLIFCSDKCLCNHCVEWKEDLDQRDD